MEDNGYDIEYKQEFLRNEILDPGYDPNVFLEFLVSKKGENGADLSLWDMNELYVVVEEFKQLYQQQQQEQQHGYEEQNNNNNYDDDYNNNNNNVVDNDNNGQQQEQQQLPEINVHKSIIIPTSKHFHSEETYCVLSEEAHLSSHPEVTVSISSPQKVETGFFAKSFITYLLTTLPTTDKTRKRYSDFEWLHQHLTLHYPHSLIPPLPTKHYDKRFNDDFLQKRMRTFEKFLNYLLQNPLLKRSNILNDFLTISKDNDFLSKKQSYSLLKPPKTAKELKTQSGLIKTAFDGEQENALQNIHQNAELNVSILRKLKTQYKLLVNEMQSVSARLHEISMLWNELYKVATMYNDNDDVKKTFTLMSNYSKQWSECELRRSELVKLDIKEYFSYVNKEFMTMKDMCVKAEGLKMNYYKESERLGNRKEELFRKGDFVKWELKEEDKRNTSQLMGNKRLAKEKMLPKETARVDEVKCFYGATLNEIIKEYERHRNLSGVNHANVISEYCRKEMGELVVMQGGLADTIANLYEATMRIVV